MKIKINGMTCEHCKRTVEKFISQIKGVQKVKVNLDKGLTDIESSRSIGKEEFIKALKDTAYKVVEVQWVGGDG